MYVRCIYAVPCHANANASTKAEAKANVKHKAKAKQRYAWLGFVMLGHAHAIAHRAMPCRGDLTPWLYNDTI